LEGRLAAAERRADEAELSARAAQERAEELARLLAAAEAARDETESRSSVAANAARADAGRAANELRYALRAKEKELGDINEAYAKLRGSAASDAAATAKNEKMRFKESEARADKLAAELREAQQQIAKLKGDLEAAERRAAASARQPSTSSSSSSNADELRRQAEREAAERKAAEQRLSEVKERLEKQQRRHEEQVAQLRQGNGSRAAPPPAPAAPPPSDETEELRRQLKEALEQFAALKEEYDKKKEAWRISSLKRHAEMNKVEQALKVSSTNEQLLKKKADMLELTLLSQQKSMDKGRVNMVREQLKEHNERLEQQGGVRDLHANATTRKTFDETYERQMDALNGKLRKLH